MIEKIRHRGIGSPRLIYQSGLEKFNFVGNRSNDTDYVNIELLKGGIAIRLKQEDYFVCALTPKTDLKKVNFESFKIKTYYQGREIIKLAARISLLIEDHTVDLLLSAAYYKPGLAFFKKPFFKNNVSFGVDPAPPIDDNGFDAGILELLRFM
ncbi:MAG: hypothetical protein AAF632_10220 [Bacteroidota bacterium]